VIAGSIPPVTSVSGSAVATDHLLLSNPGLPRVYLNEANLAWRIGESPRSSWQVALNATRLPRHRMPEGR